MKSIIAAQSAGQHAGIYSVCSANPLVIEAALRFNLPLQQPVLIEATSNQVNQFGGYTGMQPADFKQFVYQIAHKVGFPIERIILGGDHLGPNCWQHEPAESAMQKSEQLIAAYVAAGFSKIHLDASMSCADDPQVLDPEVVAERSARLCLIAEQQATAEQKAKLCYVIGTEVPVPGGAKHDLDEVDVTTTEAAKQTITTHQQAFAKLGIADAFARVIAVVVQPGVEFDHDHVVIYQDQKAQQLSQFIEQYPLVYEAHSTDYQPASALRKLVRDHFAILKVGPALTFALREALFALAHIESQLIAVEKQSRLIEVMHAVMWDEPKYWQNYYHGKHSQIAVSLDFSLSDRCRYYLPDARIEAALQRLLANFEQVKIPLGLLSQYLPQQFRRVVEGRCQNQAHALIMDKIQDVCRDYHFACVAE